MNPVVSLQRIGLTYGDDVVLRDVDLDLGEGELVLLSGRTGVGKSSLLGVVTGLVPRFTGGHLAGRVIVDGADVTGAPPRERVDTIGSVGQDPLAGFVTDTVEEELAYGMEQLGMDGGTMRRRVEETLDLLGIADLRQRALRHLSGGEQQRVAIGSVLTMHPRVLVLDEPTSALDPTAAEDVLATLTRLVHDLGLTVLLAEHRLERVVPFADRVALLTGDGGLRVGDPQDVLAESPVVPPLVDLGRAAGWDPLPLTVRDARKRARSLSLGTPPATPPPSAVEPVLTARGLTVLRGRRPVVNEVDLDLTTGRVTALMGRNGAGKSTLLWALQGRDRDAGRVEVSGVDPAAVAAVDRPAHVGLVPQTPADLLYLETADEECSAADGGTGSCRAILDRLAPGIPGDRHPRDLSEGQRLALALAFVLTRRPPVVLLDEPTRGLDYPGKHALAETLRGLAEEDRAVLVATHDVEFVAQVADDVLVLAEGEVVSRGPVREVVAQSPAYAPQVTKVLGPPWLRVDEAIR